MFCKHCGKEVSPYSAFCDRCGGLITEMPPITPVRTQVPIPTKTALNFSIISLICSSLFFLLTVFKAIFAAKLGYLMLFRFPFTALPFVLIIPTIVFAEIAFRKCINAAKVFNPLPKEYSTAKILSSIASILGLVSVVLFSVTG